MTGVIKAMVCAILFVLSLLIEKNSSCSGSSMFPLYDSGWSFTICMLPYNHKQNVLSALLNRNFLSSIFFIHSCSFLFLRVACNQMNNNSHHCCTNIIQQLTPSTVNIVLGTWHPSCDYFLIWLQINSIKQGGNFLATQAKHYVCVCMYVHMYIYMYVSVYIYILCMCVCVCVCVCVCIYIYIYICVCVYIYIYICSGSRKFILVGPQ